MHKKGMLVVICSCVFFCVSVVSADWHSESFGGSVAVSGVSFIRILPAVNNISENDDFIVSIYCEPAEPVKSWVFDLHYNQSAMSAKNVEEGDFFTGFSTFFVDGTINNDDGVITGIYSLTIGPGQENMTDQPGFLCNITFEPTVDVSSSTIWFSLSGAEEGYLTNNVTYLSCNTENGTVSLNISDFPMITWHSQSFGGSVILLEPDVDNPPVLSDEQPSDGSINQSINPMLKVDCSNDDGSNFDIFIQTNASGSWMTLASWTNVGNNTGDAMFHVLPTTMNTPNTTYYWSTNATDDHGGSNTWTNETYTLTTSSDTESIIWYSSSFGGYVSVTEEGTPDTVWHSEPFGGSVTVIEEGTPVTVWHSESFGGSVTVIEEGTPVTVWHSESFGVDILVDDGILEPGNWSNMWCIGQTSETDVNIDMIVNYQDTGDVGLHYGNTGDPGWIAADVNNDGDINYLDTGAVGLDYGNNYS